MSSRQVVQELQIGGTSSGFLDVYEQPFNHHPRRAANRARRGSAQDSI
jgi:hypothetical protein